MSILYTGQGIRNRYSGNTSGSVSSFDVPLDSTASVSLVVAYFGFTTESSNPNTQYNLLNGSTALNMRYRAGSVGTTGTHTGTSSIGKMNYFAQGANGSTSYSGEHFRVTMWVYNKLATSEPFAHPYVLGTSLYNGNSGLQTISPFGAALYNSTLLIETIRMFPQAGQFNYYRYVSWSIADQQG